MSGPSNPLYTVGRQSLVEGLAACLGDVEWASDAMARAVNNYLLDLGRTTATGVAARLSGLFNLGLDAPGSSDAALQLATLQALPSDTFDAVVREAWERVHGQDAPKGTGYIHFGGEVVLDTLRRLKPGKA